jgi:hypothetical protein
MRPNAAPVLPAKRLAVHKEGDSAARRRPINSFQASMFPRGLGTVNENVVGSRLHLTKFTSHASGEPPLNATLPKVTLSAAASECIDVGGLRRAIDHACLLDSDIA